MRLPKRGEKGFTLIELLIVVAILGVLAAVVIPNVQRFIGAGEGEARDTEFANIQTAVSAMMVDNGISSLPTPVTATATQNMALFPDTSPTADGGLGAKDEDVLGIDYVLLDKDGYILYQHDRIADADPAASLTNYVATATTAYFYAADTAGTVSQWDDAVKTTQLN